MAVPTASAGAGAWSSKSGVRRYSFTTSSGTLASATQQAPTDTEGRERASRVTPGSSPSLASSYNHCALNYG